MLRINEPALPTKDSERNSLCECRSGLKHKKCHGDHTKIEIARRVAGIVMQRLIAEERFKKGLMDEQAFRAFLDASDYKVVEFKEQESPDEPEFEEPVSVEDRLSDSGLQRCSCGSGVPVSEGQLCYKCKGN